MEDVKPKVKSELLDSIDRGYNQVLAALCQLTGRKISRHNFHCELISLEKFKGIKGELFTQKHDVLVTTEIIGELTGKSYLLMTRREFEEFASVFLSKNSHQSLHKEYLKEVDNILSAAVITHLSNQFEVKAYGDIPYLHEPFTQDISCLIYNDFKLISTDIFISAVFFSIDGMPSVHPIFLWCLDYNRILNLPHIK